MYNNYFGFIQGDWKGGVLHYAIDYICQDMLLEKTV